VIPSPKPKISAKLKSYSPPTTINTTCSADDTQTLGTWLLSIPNGTPDHDSIIKLKKGGCYDVNGSWWWRGAHNIVLDGNGATIKQATPSPSTPWVTVGGRNNPAVAPICGSTAYMDNAYSGLTSTVLLLGLEGGCDITIENLTIIGTHKTGGDPEPHAFYQPASFISLYGAKRVLIDHVIEKGPYGDFVTIDGFHEAPGGGGNYPSTDITIENSSLTDAGRAGISVTNGGQRVLVTDNTISGAGFDAFDFEQDVVYPCYCEEDINITKNTIVGIGGGSGYAFLIAADTGSEVQRVAFTDNALTKGAQMRIYLNPHAFGGTINNSVVIEGNKSTSSSSWPGRSPVNVFNMTSVLVTGNVDPPPAYGGTGYPFATLPKGSLACGDKTPAGKATDGVCPSPLPTITAPFAPVLPS
jgi:hypothetical protein